MRRRGLFAVLAIAVLATGCSGVPSSSAPHVVRSIPNGVAAAPVNTIAPQPGDDPRTIVSGFLAANVGPDAHHTAARAFLTADARNKWTDTTATIVNTTQVQLPDASGSVTVTATPLGNLDQRGLYTPTLQGDGTSGTPVPFSFGMQKVNGQWRISSLANGLIVTRDAFQNAYVARRIYYLDSTQRQVVPDLRYSALSGQTLCNWLLEQMVGGPPSSLAPAVNSDLPVQTAKPSVNCNGTSTVVDLPGISASNGQTRVRLAAQLAYTFSLDAGSTVMITDGGPTHLVAIPGVGSPFSASSFPTFSSNGTIPLLYYLHDGGVVDENGTPVVGPIGAAKNALTSIALAAGASTQNLQVAGTTAVVGHPGDSQLVVGTSVGGLTATGVQGRLSRPTFAPRTAEVWVASGSTLLRVLAGVPTPVTVTGASGAAGAIRSIAFSSDGVRLAMVVVAADGTAQLWVGTVVRSGEDVRVEALTQLTPPGVVVTDVAWNNPTTLYLLGYYAPTPTAFGIWSVQSDGSSFTARSTLNLPGAPDAIAAAPNVSPWVSVGQTVWVQRNNSWAAPGGVGVTAGSAPTYLQ